MRTKVKIVLPFSGGIRDAEKIMGEIEKIRKLYPKIKIEVELKRKG